MRRAGGGMLEWLIVGGGVHGTYLSNFLSRSYGYTEAELAIIDPFGEPLKRWKHATRNVGMAYLRSAAVHHLDLPSLSLKRFAASQARRLELPLLPPYGRPPLALFNEHADRTVRAHRLDRFRRSGRVVRLDHAAGHFEVAYLDGSRERLARSKRVLLAIGMNDQTCWPEWAAALEEMGASVAHVLDPGFSRPERPDWSRLIVYGGGQSGAQLSLALAALKPGSVTLVSGHRMAVHLFDSEPSWQGVNFMRLFAAESDPTARRAIIARERHRGSVTPEVERELAAAIEAGSLRFMEVDPASVTAAFRPDGANGEPITLRTNRGNASADRLLLATGYDQRRPGGAWLDEAVERLALPVGPCGYPLPSVTLEWMAGLYLSGPLAELEIGPVARNISGAHRTASRLEYFFSP
jgi:thioredoxin reductase